MMGSCRRSRTALPAGRACRRARPAEPRGRARWRLRRRGEPAAGGGAVLLAGDAGRRQDPPAAPSCATAPRRPGWRVARRPLPRLRRQRPALPARSASCSAGSPATSPSGRRALIADPAGRSPGCCPAAGLIAGADRRAPPSRLDRGDLFDAVHAALERPRRASAPLLVVIEDVHWADQSTRDLLSFLFARGFRPAGRRRRVLPHRRPAPPAPAARHGVAEWARAARRQPRSQLDPLRRRRRTHARPAAARPARCPRARSARDRQPGRGQRVLRRGAGRPPSRADGGRTLPDDLADLLLVRLDRLDETAARVVRVAVGRRSAGARTTCSPRSSASTRRPTSTRAARGRRRQRPGPARASTATPSGTRCSPRRSTTTCCPASGCGCTRRTPRR